MDAKYLITRLKKKELQVFLLMLPILKPECLDYVFVRIGTLFNIGRVLSVTIMLVAVLRRRIKVSNVSKIILLLNIWILVTTLINGTEIKGAVLSLLVVTAMVLIVEYYMNYPFVVLNALFHNFEVIIYLNLLSLILFPNGLYIHGVHDEFICYFLGFKNSYMGYCLMAIFLATCNILYNRRYKSSIFLILASYAQIVISWSALSVVAISCVILCLVVFFKLKKIKILKYFSFTMLFVSYVAVNVLVVFFHITENVPFIASFIENVLGKSSTLTGRMDIWNLGIDLLVQKPIIGYGLGQFIEYRGYTWYGHNQFIELFLEGGIVAVILFIIIMILISRKIKRITKTNIYYVVMASYIGLFIYFIGEAGKLPIFYLFYLITYYSGSYERIFKSRKSRIVKADRSGKNNITVP